MFRLLALLQLTRAALAFTAVADAWTILLLRRPLGENTDSFPLTILKMLLIAIISLGLYGFGMALNDLLDARRDRVFAPRRPIPSGRIRPRSAVVIALFLLITSLIAAAVLSLINILGALHIQSTPVSDVRAMTLMPWPFIWAIVTAILIVIYDGTTKYLGGIGLLTLGVIRAVHCLIADPPTPLLYLSMFLLCHIFFVSLAAYKLENKRPRLTPLNVWFSILCVVALCALAIAYMDKRGAFHHNTHRMIFGPALAAAVFIAWSLGLMRNPRLSPRQKGERLVLMGLFWLFVYDASMLFSNGQFLAGVAVVLLFLCALITFLTIRKLSRALAQPKVPFRADHMQPETAL